MDYINLYSLKKNIAVRTAFESVHNKIIMQIDFYPITISTNYQTHR